MKNTVTVAYCHEVCDCLTICPAGGNLEGEEIHEDTGRQLGMNQSNCSQLRAEEWTNADVAACLCGGSRN
jgi:hypothetical protein